MPNKNAAREWLKIAYHDYASAKILYEANHYTDSIGNDLQQSLEKILKSLYAYDNLAIKKSHDLVEVYAPLIQTLPLNDEEITYLEMATEYFKEDRYPNPYYNLPKREEVKKVLDFTESLLMRVLELLTISLNEISN